MLRPDVRLATAGIQSRMSRSCTCVTWSSFWPSDRACWNLRNQSESLWPSPICTRLRLSTPPTSARLQLSPSIMPAASMAPIMLVEQAMTVEKAGIVGSMPASISTSRAMLLHIRLGTTAPQTAKSGRPRFSNPTIWRATGTESSIASRSAKAPSTLAKGVRTPEATQTSVVRAMKR